MLTAIAVASGAAAINSAGASAPPTSPPADEPTDPIGEEPVGSPATDELSALPDGYDWLVDDTGLLTVAVPDTWSDVDTAATTADDGLVVPRIVAAPDMELYHATFDVAGVEYFAIPYTDDPQATIDEFGLNTGCGDITVDDYTDPVFSGLVQVGTDCGETEAATWNMVVASPDDESLTAIVRVQTASDADEEALQVVLQSFNIVEGVDGGPGTSVPGEVSPTDDPALVADCHAFGELLDDLAEREDFGFDVGDEITAAAKQQFAEVMELLVELPLQTAEANAAREALVEYGQMGIDEEFWTEELDDAELGDEFIEFVIACGPLLADT